MYLAAVEDLRPRKIVGWSKGTRIDSRLVVDALEMAVSRRPRGERLVALSDRGSQYASEHYQQLLKRARAHLKYEPAGELLGKCAYGIVLREPKE